MSLFRRVGLAEAYTRWVVNYGYLEMTCPTCVDWDHWYSEAIDGLSILYREDSCIVFKCLEIILPHVSDVYLFTSELSNKG